MIRLYEFFYWAMECGSAAYNAAIKTFKFLSGNRIKFSR